MWMGVTVLDAAYLIPFKVRAWLDLLERKTGGERVDSKDIKKHRNDVFRLTQLLNQNTKPLSYLPHKIKIDMCKFIERIGSETVDLEQLGIRGMSKDEIFEELKRIYG